MFVIVVYDVASKKGNELRKYLRQHLNWVQNSVFEGEVTETEFKMMILAMRMIIDNEKDSILYYTFSSVKHHERGVIGMEKNSIDTFI